MTKFAPVQHADRSPALPTRLSNPLQARTEPPADAPRFGEVMCEIGLLLAIHLSVAFAIVASLRLSGIA
jgi:hypothetical protein